MNKAVVIAAVSGLVALVAGLLLGFALHRVIDPSQPQSVSTRLEEQVTLAVGSDNRQHPSQQQVASLAMVVGQQLIEASALHPQPDAVSKDRIQRNVDRILHAGLLDHIPYADKRAASIQHALCLRDNPRDAASLASCLRRSFTLGEAGRMATAAVSFKG